MATNRLPEALPEPVGVSTNSHGGLVQVSITFQGVTPLLMNAMSADEVLALWTKQKPSRTAARPTPAEEAARHLHCLPDGRPIIPLRAMMATFINAGQFIRLDGKRQISTEKKTVLPGMFTLLSSEILLTKHDGETTAEWEVDIQQGRNPNGSEAVCIIRPRFDEWQFEVLVEIDQGQMPLGMARELVDVAGRRVGLLEFTPRHKGTYGRFNVVSWVKASV